MDGKRIRTHIAIDRISDLPCNVIDDIFKYLPLRDAARTSVLSRGWQNKWLGTPYLVFDQNFKHNLPGDCNIESIIYQVLLLHKGPIVKFILEHYCLQSRHAVTSWLHFLSNHGIQELTLVSYSLVDRPIPHHLYTFHQLRRLCLFKCILRPPSAFKGFGRLVGLCLSDVVIAPGDFRRFISKCPMLEHLELSYHCETTSKLEIDAPNLKSFCLVWYSQPPSICLRNTSLLEEILISLGRWSSLRSEDFEANWDEFFGQISSVKKLTIGPGFLKYYSRDGVPEKLPNNLSHLMDLKLHSINFVSIGDVSCALCLIRSSPNLETLQIEAKMSHGGDEKLVAQFLKEQEKFVHNQLKSVKIKGLFLGSEAEMEFVKLLLSSTTALIKLELEFCFYGARATKEEESQLLKELARFPSSKAEIITRIQ